MLQSMPFHGDDQVIQFHLDNELFPESQCTIHDRLSNSTRCIILAIKLDLGSRGGVGMCVYRGGCIQP